MLTKKDVKTESKNKEDKCCGKSDENQSYALSKTPSREVGLAEQQKSNNQYHQDSGSPLNKTRIYIKFDCGFNNHLYIRGQGANLRWDKGQLLKNVKADEWVWETDAKFPSCEFKILINDSIYETGPNHRINCCGSLSYTPHF